MTRKDPVVYGSRNTCPSGKVAHPTRREARKHATRHQQQHGDHVRPYVCPDCGFWHVGHLATVVLRGGTAAADYYRRGA